MDGPSFLVLYVIVAVVVIAGAFLMVRARDETGQREPPQVPAVFDAYEIAYLRGGKYAVIRTVIYALYKRGLVEIMPRKWYQTHRLVAKHDVPVGPLTGLEARIFGAVRSPADASILFGNELASDVERLCEPLRHSLESEQLYRSDADRSSAMAIPVTATIILLGLAAYRFLAEIALPHHGSFRLLVVLTVVSLVALWGWVVGPAITKRISDRGRTYLNRIQTAYRGVDMSTVAMVGLFGIGILANTSDAAFAKLFPKGESGGWADVGGGGCGGGCGGCGGGGD